MGLVLESLGTGIFFFTNGEPLPHPAETVAQPEQEGAAEVCDAAGSKYSSSAAVSSDSNTDYNHLNHVFSLYSWKFREKHLF